MLNQEPLSPTGQDGDPIPAGCGDGADDELALAFPNCSFTHVLTVISHDRLRATVTILSLLDATGARLTALRVTRVDERLEHRITVSGLRPHEARELSRHLSVLPSVRCALVEHQISRAS